MTSGDRQEWQAEIESLGLNIFQKASEDNGSIFSRDWWYGRIMEWSMKNESFKTQMFRFVDVLPYLNSGKDVARHLQEYFENEEGEMPSVLNFGMGLGSLAPGLMAGAIRKNVMQMARMFITGETPKDALKVLKKARKKNIGFTVDILGEATLSETEALDYQRKYLELIDWLTRDADSWDSNELLDSNHRGSIPRVNISVKITSLYSQIKAEAWQESIDAVKERLRPIFRSAMEKKAFINIDMESFSVKDLTLEVFEQLLLEEEFKSYPHWGIVVQAYLRSSLKDCERLLKLAQKRDVPITLRLVKGAYWDYETIGAEQKSWEYPVYTNKQESDANYEDCAEFILKNHQFLNLSIGSHNVRSISACLVMAEKLGVPKNAIEIQMLYGMADGFKTALTGMGYRLREYCPVGELIPGMAYLVRRLLENTSNESFLRSKFVENAEAKTLLKDPNVHLEKSSDFPAQSAEKFYNEPLLDFTKQENRADMLKALDEVKRQFGETVALHIDGKDLKTDRTLDSLNPSRFEEVVGSVYLASTNDVDVAVRAAQTAFPAWSQTDPLLRAQILDRLADIIAKKRFELTALEVYEAGKTWHEADGDITEAIDFCRYYARDMKALSRPHRVGHAPGEVSLYHYQARGVTAVIAPWNFPLAILAGMTTAAFVAGNTVVMKPAEQTPIIARRLMDMIIEAGVPEGVVNFLPGLGEEVGQALVDHKDVSLIAFTGSQEVGLKILERAGHTQIGQSHVKKCLIEMGGKNALIIDSDADLDEAVDGVIYSAFGFQGQKCSAASRVIVLKENYDRFVDRLLDTAASLKVRSSDNPEAYLGPVIDQGAYDKILGMIEKGKAEAQLAFQAKVPEGGYYAPPTIFTDVDPKASIAQEEIFGPVLAVIKANDIEHAIEIANDTVFGLTGGLYSRSPAHIEYVKKNFQVGNLYINRSITGAMVERHPFGGFKMSGIGSKTGGPDYLKQFMEPRCITENTMRRGFAPAENETQS